MTKLVDMIAFAYTVHYVAPSNPNVDEWTSDELLYKSINIALVNDIQIRSALNICETFPPLKLIYKEIWKYKEKLKAIERSNYLSFCYESLEKSQMSLVIFGSSLSNQDAHIVKAINYKKNCRDLAISIHIGKKSAKILEEELKYFQNKFPKHKINFYDSQTLFEF